MSRTAWRAMLLGATVTLLTCVPLVVASPACADDIAYLVNVTVRPGYGFRDAADALAYGHVVCDQIAAGRPYAQLIGDVEVDRGTSDDYQAAYLINQSANELCPTQIWQLRQSAAHYRPMP